MRMYALNNPVKCKSKAGRRPAKGNKETPPKCKSFPTKLGVCFSLLTAPSFLPQKTREDFLIDFLINPQRQTYPKPPSFLSQNALDLRKLIM